MTHHWPKCRVNHPNDHMVMKSIQILSISSYSPFSPLKIEAYLYKILVISNFLGLLSISELLNVSFNKNLESVCLISN